MIDFPSWLKMIFEFIKRLFGLVEEGSRKRGADRLDDLSSSFVSPKKHCCRVDNPFKNSRIVYADENVEEEIEYLGETHYSLSKNRSNGSNCVKRRRSTFIQQSLQQSVHQICQKKSSLKMNGKDTRTAENSMKKNMAGPSNWRRGYSTLKKTNQLREKQEYGQLLQNFLPHRLHVIREKPNADANKETVTEVIDLENYETPLKRMTERVSCSQTSRDIFFTPKSSTPLKWSTPRASTSRDFERTTKTEKDVTIVDDEMTSKDNIPNSVSSSRGTTRKIVEIAKSERVGPFIIVEHVADDEEHSPPTKSTLDEIEKTTSRTSIVNNVEIVPTNTLRDNLSAKAVMKQDFIPRITDRYNERYEQRMKEAEEIKRMTCLLSKHNRLAREAALETQLARSMRLCEAVLDETSALDEEPLPALTPEMLRDVKNALVPQPANEVIVENFGLRITRKDINTLAGLNWLNDEVINFYMNLLIARGNENERFPKVHAMNTFFYPKLLTGGHSSLKRWTRKIDIFAQDLLVVPIHLGIHWCMSVIDFRKKTIRYFDSMGGANPKCLSALRQYLQDESMDKKKRPYDMNDWKLESVASIPQQMNGSDCGVFSCMFAEFISAARKITFTQEDMPYFRKKMVYEIIKGKLL